MKTKLRIEQTCHIHRVVHSGLGEVRVRTESHLAAMYV